MNTSSRRSNAAQSTLPIRQPVHRTGKESAKSPTIETAKRHRSAVRANCDVFFAICWDTSDSIVGHDWPLNGVKIDISLGSIGIRLLDKFNERMIDKSVAKHCQLIDKRVQELILGKRQFMRRKLALPSLVIPERFKRPKKGMPITETPIHYHCVFLMHSHEDAEGLAEVLSGKIDAKLKRSLRPCEGYGSCFNEINVHIEPIEANQSRKVIGYATKYAYDLIQHAVIRRP